MMVHVPQKMNKKNIWRHHQVNMCSSFIFDQISAELETFPSASAASSAIASFSVKTFCQFTKMFIKNVENTNKDPNCDTDEQRKVLL